MNVAYLSATFRPRARRTPERLRGAREVRPDELGSPSQK
jgi:hypothetical protein